VSNVLNEDDLDIPTKSSLFLVGEGVSFNNYTLKYLVDFTIGRAIGSGSSAKISICSMNASLVTKEKKLLRCGRSCNVFVIYLHRHYHHRKF